MGVCVLGGCAGRIFPTLPGLGLATQFGIRSCSGSVAYGPDASPPTAWTRPSFRPRGAICLARLHHTTRTTRHSYQREPIGNALRQCPRGKFHEDSQIRGSLPHRIPRPRGSQGFDQAVSGKSLQPATLAFGAGLSSAAGVRTQLTTLASHGGKTSMSFVRHEEIYRSDVTPGDSWERQLVVAAPALIGCDEFPVGYSLADCPPAEPASASPTGDDSQQSTRPYNDFSANGNYPLNFLSQSKGALQPSTLLALPAPSPQASTTQGPSRDGSLTPTVGSTASCVVPTEEESQ